MVHLGVMVGMVMFGIHGAGKSPGSMEIMGKPNGPYSPQSLLMFAHFCLHLVHPFCGLLMANSLVKS
jgi:hypothetical protein